MCIEVETRQGQGQLKTAEDDERGETVRGNGEWMADWSSRQAE